MSKAATITIFNQGAGVGPFNLYALDSGGNIIQTIKLNVPLASLLTGYNVYGLPDDIVSVKIDSNNVLCDATQTVTIQNQTPPACNCITIENPVDQTIYYSYVDCNGDNVNNVTLGPVSAAQVCGTGATSGSSDVVITEGAACNSRACINGSLRIINNTTYGSVSVTNITPTWFYSFNNPPTFPDDPQVNFPVSYSGAITSYNRIKYNDPITVTLTSTVVTNVFVQLFRNQVLMESINITIHPATHNTVVLNSVGAYTFNTTDEVKIVVLHGRE
jgi:hypothetical protein